MLSAVGEAGTVSALSAVESFTGRIISIRRPSRALIFLSMQADDDDALTIQVLLARESLVRFEALASLLRVGCDISCCGQVFESPWSLSEASHCDPIVVTARTLHARDVLLRSLILQPFATMMTFNTAGGIVARLLTRVADGTIPISEAASATHVAPATIAAAVDSVAGTKALVAAIMCSDSESSSSSHPHPHPHPHLLPPPPPRTRPPRFSCSILQCLALFETASAPLFDIIQDDNANAKAKLKLDIISGLGAAHPVARAAVNAAQDTPCLRPTARVPTRGTYASLKKGPQVEWIIAYLARHPPFFDLVVDVGGGRGDLVIAVATAFPKVSVILVDSNSVAREAAQARASALGLTNVTFRRDVPPSDYYNDAAAANSATPWSHSLYVGLHTCGGLTDAAIAAAVAARASFLIVPCCYGRMRSGSEGGGGVRDATKILPLCLSTLPPAHVDAVLRIAESPDRTLALRAMGAICTVRLRSAGLQRSVADATRFSSSLQAFDAEASARNLVLVSMLASTEIRKS